MKKTTHALVFAALALAGCGDDAIKPMNPNAGEPGAVTAQGAPAAPVAAAPQHAESGSWFMPAAIGYLLGSMSNRSPQVVQAPAAPSYSPPAQPRKSWWSSLKDKKTAAAPTAAPARPTPAPSKPPVLSTSPQTFSVPKPTAAPKPSYSGPSSYKAPSYSFKPSPSYSSPSRSFSSGRR